MDIITHLKTNATKFVLPLLFEEGVKYDDILPKHFKNAYIADIDKQEVDGYILLKYKSSYEFDDNDGWYENLIDIECADIYEKDGDLIYCFEIPDKFLDDYYLFLAGKYSKLSKEAKVRILEFWEAEEDTLLHGILYKTEVGHKFWEERLGNEIKEWSVEAEYWFAPNTKREILGFEPITI